MPNTLQKNYSQAKNLTNSLKEASKNCSNGEMGHKILKIEISEGKLKGD